MRHEFDKYQGDAGESLGIKINVREMIYAAIRKFSLMRIKIDAESSYAGQRSLPAIARCSGEAAGNWMLVHQRRIKCIFEITLRSFKFENEQFFRCARPHKGLRRGVLVVRRGRKPAENAAHRKKGHFRMETIWVVR